MTDFSKILTPVAPDLAPCAFASRTKGRAGSMIWREGLISISFLDHNFGQYATAAEMKAATESEGLHLFFDHLASEGMIPAE